MKNQEPQTTGTMGLTNGTGVLFAAVLFLAGSFIGPKSGILYAQAGIPGQLGAEIQNLEQRLSINISPIERYDVLIRLARLRQLSGNIASAAACWLDAAAANPNDDSALVSGAYCLAAIGEWERAALSLQPLIASGKRGASVMQARYLDAYLRAWTTNDVSTLTAFAESSEFTTLRPMIYYTLWQIITCNPGITGANGGGELWKTRLLAEFPQSPEARAADPNDQKDSISISAVQSPVWLLFPGAAAPSPPATTPPPAITVKPAEPAALPAVIPPSTVNTASAVVLQTGLFSREANAQSQSESLRRAGFNTSIIRKQVNGTEYWAVTVNSNQSESTAIADLKKAGFDSFPVK